MGLLTQDDVAKIQGNLKDAESAMKSAQAALDKRQNELTESFDKLNKVGNKISEAQGIIDTEAANIKSYQDIIVSTKQAITDKDAAIAAAKAAGNVALAKQLDQEKDALSASLDSTESKLSFSKVKEADAKADMADFQQSYDGTKDAISTLQAEEANIKAELADHTKNFNEYSNSTILGQFENEKKTRKEIASKAVRNKERIMPLLKNANTGLDEKMEEFTSDTNIFIEDIKTELGIDEGATEIIKQSIDELNAEYEKKGTEGVFMASKALELSRKSLFDLELAGINKLIKAACYKGQTSIKIAEHKITGTQIVALNEGGYKVSHEKVDERAKNNPEVMIIIDWGFVGSEK